MSIWVGGWYVLNEGLILNPWFSVKKKNLNTQTTCGIH